MSIDSVEGLPEHPDGIPGYDLFPMAQEAGMEARVEYISDDATALNADGAGWIIVSPAATVRARRRAGTGWSSAPARGAR